MHSAKVAVVLAVSYPLLLLAGVWWDAGILRHAGLLALIIAVGLPGLVAGRRSAWLGTTIATAGFLWLVRSGSTMLPLLLAPVLIPAGAAWIFGRTLLPGRVALIEQLVRVLHGGELVDHARLLYARRLTIAWTALLAALAASNAALGAVTSPGGLVDHFGIDLPFSVSNRLWAGWTGVAGYAVVALFFVAEFAYRQRRFPQQPYDGFVDFVRRSAAAAPALLAGRAPASGNDKAPGA